MARLVGYRYWVCEIGPAPDFHHGEWINKLCYRDTIEDAQRVVNVLGATSITFECYVILADPIFKQED